jgi:serine/threonine protein kinase/dipeptidyl aminopeptidase/acylaminoacyl peptidase
MSLVPTSDDQPLGGAPSGDALPLDTIGPYRLVSRLGAGGMGEVFRAHDARLGRDVAIKLLHATAESDPSRVRRFEQEARAASSIDHPAVVHVYDVGVAAERHYLVTELLEGEPLRAIADRGPLDAHALLTIAWQLTDALAAAHARGVVHRDLKPENLFLTRRGQLKILDFGIASLAAGVTAPSATVSDLGTSPGTVLGTAGYMSPEQVRGLPTDARTDLFSVGAVLFELASGARAFPGATAIDRALAIVSAEPAPLVRADLPAAFGELVRGCLAKRVDDRVQSARDLARFFGALARGPGVTTPTAATPRPADAAPGLDARALVDATPAPPLAPSRSTHTLEVPRRHGRGALALAWVGSLALAALATIVVARPRAAPPSAFTRITFEPGSIGNARFAPDGKNVIFSRTQGIRESRIFTVLPGAPETRALTPEGFGLASVSRQGELAVGMSAREHGKRSMLARLPLAGGAPRPLRTGIWEADWSPDGRELAAIVQDDARLRLEYPVGHVLHEAAGWLSSPRVSPDGDRVAIAEHPQAHDDMGYVALVTRDGALRRLTPRFGSIAGLAWRPGGEEIVFTAAETGTGRSIFYVDLDGHVRRGPTAPVDMMVLDVAPDGTLLLKRDLTHIDVLGRHPGAEDLTNLRLFDWGIPVGVDDAGKSYAFVEGGAAGGAQYLGYFRGLDGSPPMRLGAGTPLALSGDGRRVLMVPENDRTRLVVLSTDLGPATPLPPGEITEYETAAFLPDGRAAVLLARARDGQRRLFVQSTDGAAAPRLVPHPRPLPTMALLETSPDGREVIIHGPGDTPRRIALESGEDRPLVGLDPGDVPARWTDAGELLVVTTTVASEPGLEECDRTFEARIFAVDLETGARRVHFRLPAEMYFGRSTPGAIRGISGMAFSRDGRAFVIGVRVSTSDLYLLRPPEPR